MTTCRICGSSDLWDDMASCGCNRCGAICFHGEWVKSENIPKLSPEKTEKVFTKCKIKKKITFYDVRHVNSPVGCSYHASTPLKAALLFAKEEGLETCKYNESYDIEVRDGKRKSSFYTITRQTKITLECVKTG